jgi:hypothetical protein
MTGGRQFCLRRIKDGRFPDRPSGGLETAAPCRPQAGLPPLRMFRVSLELLRQIRRNVRDD